MGEERASRGERAAELKLSGLTWGEIATELKYASTASALKAARGWARRAAQPITWERQAEVDPEEEARLSAGILDWLRLAAGPLGVRDLARALVTRERKVARVLALLEARGLVRRRGRRKDGRWALA